MCKKFILAGAAALLVGGLLFGGKVLPYAQTAFQQAQDAVNDSVSVDFQLEAAKTQLQNVRPQINNMNQQIAKERVQINRLTAELDRLNDGLEKSRDEMLTLRQHMDSGDQVYVATNGRAYTNERVSEDLRHRFSVYKTAEQTRDKQMEILELREQALDSAMEKLEQARTIERELHVQIENLNARNRMVQVAETASTLDIDNSQIARTQDMLDDISAKIDVKEEMLNMAPENFGSIPVSADSVQADTDIVSEIDQYFEADVNEDDFVKN